MNISQRLRKLADSTGLDAFGDEIRAIADEMDACGSAGTQSDPQAGLTFTGAAQPAEVTLDEVMQAAKEATAPEWQDVVDGWHMGLDLMAFARAILALRPVQVPMTDEQVDAFTVNGRLHWLGKRQLIRGVEAYYGIVAKAEGREA